MAFSEEEDTNFMDISPVNGAESIDLSQYTRFPETQNANALAFLAYSKSILWIVLAGLLLTSVFVFCHQLMKQKLEGSWNLRKLANQLRRLSTFFRESGQSTYLTTRPNLVRVCFLLFLFLTFNLITSNISEKAVIVDDSILIDSRAKLFQTNKWVCWFDDSDFDYFKRSNEGSDIWKVINEMKRPDGDFCFLNQFFDDPSLIGDFPITQTFFLSKKINNLFAMSIFAGLAENKIAFQAGALLDYELLQVMYMSKLTKESIKQRLLSK